MKHVILVGLLLVLVIVPFAAAETISIEPSSINLDINQTNEQQVNITIESNYSGVLFLNVFLPFIEIEVEPRTITFPNGTNVYYPIITASVPDDFPSGNYAGKLEYITTETTGEIDVNIYVLEKHNYSLGMLKEKSVVTGEIGSLIINITNGGNTDLFFNLTTNSTLIEPFVNNINVYRQGKERTIWEYRIPDNLSPGEYDETILFGRDEYNIRFIVEDDTLPSLSPDAIPELKVNEDFGIYVTATDNVELKEVYLDLICEGVEAFKYVLVEFAEDRFYTDVDPLAIPTSCVAHIYAVDESENQNLTSVYFSVDYTYGVTYSGEIVVPKFKTDFLKKIRIIDANESINVTVKLLELEHPNLTNSSDYFSIGIDNGHSFGKLDMVGVEEVIDGKAIYLNFESTVIGPFSGKVLVTLPEYIMNDNIHEIEFVGEVGLYTVSDPFSGEIYDVQIDCTPHDLGTFAQSYSLCRMKIPIDVDPEDAVLPVSFHQIGLTDENYQHQLKEEKEPLERHIAALQSWLASLFVLFMIALLMVWIYLKPTVYHLGGY